MLLPSDNLDMQKIDMGIALCHFDLVAKECGLNVRFGREKNAPVYENVEYVATFFVQ